MNAHDRARPRWLGRPRLDLDEIDGTSAQLWRWVADEPELPAGALVTAVRQTQGKGRQGRTWTSPAGNLHVSLLLRPTRPMPEIPALSLIVGQVLVRTLVDDLGVGGAGLKWPNDVEVEGRKVAGILLESRFRPRPLVVVGVGVNLVTPGEGWPDDLATRALALDACGVRVDPAGFLAAWLPRLEEAVERFDAAGFADFHEEVEAVSILDGRTVDLWVGAERETVQVVGVASDGGLRCRARDGRERVVHGGEVHLGGQPQ